MTESTQTRSVVIDRDLPHPPEKVWRALTDGALIEQWLMKNDFEPAQDHRFTFSADWGSVEGKVLAIKPTTLLSYTWEAYGLESVVTWTLAPTETGTHLRMEQSGFLPSQEQAYQGAIYGWQKFIGALETVVADL
jgi:uncharacterized protein YndB with AHSA1/START domain